MDAADNLLHNKLTPQRLTPRKTTYISCSSTSRGRGRLGGRFAEPIHMISPTRPAPPPTRPSSRRPQQVWDENRRSTHDEDVGDERASDAASKIWAKIRRASGLSLAHHRRDISTSTTASVAASVISPFSSACATDGRALRRKKAGLTDRGGLMMQRQRLDAMGSKQSLTDRTNLNMAEDSGLRRSSKSSSKGRRSSGRWGFSNWWVNG